MQRRPHPVYRDEARRNARSHVCGEDCGGRFTPSPNLSVIPAHLVIPAKAGIQRLALDSGSSLHSARNDGWGAEMNRIRSRFAGKMPARRAESVSSLFVGCSDFVFGFGEPHPAQILVSIRLPASSIRACQPGASQVVAMLSLMMAGPASVCPTARAERGYTGTCWAASVSA